MAEGGCDRRIARPAAKGRWRLRYPDELPFGKQLSCKQALEIRDGALQSGLERDVGAPIEEFAGAGNIRAALPGSSSGRRRYSSRDRDPVDAMISSAACLIVVSSGLPRLTGSVKSRRTCHETHEPFDEVVDA